VGEIIGIDNYLAVVQNKIDLVGDRDRLIANYRVSKDLVTGTHAQSAPVIPTCLSPIKQVNLELLLQAIDEKAQPRTVNTTTGNLLMYCVRSFDINKAGVVSADGLKGGVLGGTILSGSVKIGQELELKPGICVNGQWQTLYTTVTSLYTGKVKLDSAQAGGLIGVGTDLDPSFTRSDGLVGQTIGLRGELPTPVTELAVQVYSLQGKDKISQGDIIQISIGGGSVNAQVTAKSGRKCTVTLGRPTVVTELIATVAISKKISGMWTLVARGDLRKNAGSDKLPESSQSLEEYLQLLTQTLQTVQPAAKTALSLSTPVMYRDGGAKTVWINFTDTCKDIARDPEHVSKFFQAELATAVTIGGEGQLVIHSKKMWKASHIQGILIKYINEFVRCRGCKGTATVMSKGAHGLTQTCSKCGVETIL
jgi:translation initiation factor 2 beta subunit (eIF-2beta)/eIF-5